MHRPSSAASVAVVDAHLLKAGLARATRRRTHRALLLVLPLALFVVVTFVMPIVVMLGRSVYDPDLGRILPRSAAAFQRWDGAGLPPEPVWQALADDLREARSAGMVGKAGTILNYEIAGTRSLLTRTAQQLDIRSGGDAKPALLAIDKRWGESNLWGALKRSTANWTITHYANALDWRIIGYSTLTSQPPEQRIYVVLFLRTAKVGALVTLFCLLLGYPVAHLLATLPLRLSNLLMILVLLPFWTSLLVRTTAWIVLLQKEGVINDALVALGIIADERRVPLIYNQT